MLSLTEEGRLQSAAHDHHRIQHIPPDKVPQLGRPQRRDEHKIGHIDALIQLQQIMVASHEHADLPRELLEDKVGLVDHHVLEPLQVGAPVTKHAQQTKRRRAYQDVAAIYERDLVLILVSAPLQKQGPQGVRSRQIARLLRDAQYFICQLEYSLGVFAGGANDE